jgi:hypothetical protein
MTIKNGKWVDEFGNGINKEALNGHEFISFRDKFIGLYGSDGVSYSRLDIVSSLIGMSPEDEGILSKILLTGLLKRFRV